MISLLWPVSGFPTWRQCKHLSQAWAAGPHLDGPGAEEEKGKEKKISKKRDTLGDISKSLLCYTRVSLYERIIIYLTGSTLRGLLFIFSLFLTNTASVNILVHMYKNPCKINA